MTEPKCFDPDTPCVKCGYDNAGSTYIPAEHGHGELMSRDCQCGYFWYEVPLDVWNQRKYHDAVERDL